MLARPDQWRQTLLAAADYIEAHGWCQGSRRDYLGRVCIVEAIDMVTAGGPALYNPAFNAFYDRLGTSPSVWNDTTGRTKDEVLKELRNCAREGL